MRKRIAKTFVAAALITSIAGTSVWADDVTDLTNKKNAAESQLSQTQSELADACLCRWTNLKSRCMIRMKRLIRQMRI